jgi:shikimate dehydrogenase
MKHACVIGWPISHSRSPIIHGYWLKTMGIAGQYDAVAVPPEKLPDFFTRLRAGEYCGCNVTMPHKEEAARHVDIVLPEARRAGSVNTIFWQDGKLVGTSTDGAGFIANLEASVPAFAWQGRHVLLLGAGGSARALIAAMGLRGIGRLSLWNRNPDRARAVQDIFGPPIGVVDTAALPAALEAADLVINTTPPAAALSEMEGFDLSRLNPTAVVADIVYVPLETPFLLEAKRRGHQTVPGLGMLLHQAVGGFEHWFGTRPEVTPELHALVAADIAREQKP